MICEKCARKMQPFYRSHRRGPVERFILSPMNIYPFRCPYCQHRMYAFGRSSPSAIQGRRGLVLERLSRWHLLPTAGAPATRNTHRVQSDSAGALAAAAPTS